MVSNMGLNIIFAIPYGYVGLAIATSISATLNAGLLWFGLYQRGIYQKQKDSVSVLVRIMIAGLAMAVGLVIFNPSLLQWSQLSWLEAALKLFYLIAGGAVLYLFALGVTGLRFRHFQIRTAK